MKTFARGTLGALAVFALPSFAVAQVRTLTFDAGDPIGGLVAGSILSNQYNAFGVSFIPNAFSGVGITPGQNWATNTGMKVVSSTGSDVGGLGTPALVSGNIIRSFNDWLAENGDPSFRANFSVAVDQVSIDFAGVATPADVRLFAFNGATLLGSVTGTVTTGQFKLAFNAAPGQTITSVSVSPGSFNDWVGFDNFTYRQVSTVPEPSTLGLFGIGMAALLVITRRRRVQ